MSVYAFNSVGGLDLYQFLLVLRAVRFAGYGYSGYLVCQIVVC